MTRPRQPHLERKNLNVTITVPREDLEVIDAERKLEGSQISAYFLRAMNAYLAAPQLGGRRILPTSGFAILQIGTDEFCFIPRNWTPAELRRAAEVLEMQSPKP